MAQVKGFDPAISGQLPEDVNGDPVPIGVWGDSSTGGGVFGTSGVLPSGVSIPIDVPAGVEGHGVDGPGTVGRSLNDSGVVGESPGAPGVLARSITASGVLGVTFSPDDGSHGVFGSSTAGGNGVTGFVGSATGSIGSSVRGIGVRGTTGSGEAGVLGQTFGDGSGKAGPAVHGSSGDGVGVSGVSGSTDGTQGLTFGNGYGHYSLHFSPEPGGGVLGVSVLGSGVEGFTFSSIRNQPDSAAVRGQSANGFAGLFLGPVRVTGPLQKAGGGFTVDHPQDPKNKYLSHSFVESPEMLNVYSGTVTTNRSGVARVRLPPYFEALNRDFRYQLTVIGEFARAMVSQEVKRNEFAIRTDPGGVKVCWQVTGVRKDAWAEANRIPVEENKPKSERGKFLHPELFGKQADGVHALRAARMPGMFPDTVRSRVEKTLSAARPQGTDREVDALLRQARRSFDEQVASGRARLSEEWNAVRKGLAAMPPLQPPHKRKR